MSNQKIYLFALEFNQLIKYKIKNNNNNEEIKQNLLFNDFNERNDKISTQKNINFKDYSNKFSRNEIQINASENYTIKILLLIWNFISIAKRDFFVKNWRYKR